MISFLANLSSRHVENWFRLYQECDVAVSRIYTVHREGEAPHAGDVVICHPFPHKVANYLALGLLLRATNPRPQIIHAHGASGYGLAALVSGIDYAVTVYGSEVLAVNHSLPYREMVRRVLQKAVAVTVTSEEAAWTVREVFGVPEERIYCFHTGIDTDLIRRVFTENRPSISGDAATFLSVRNAAPQYRTLDILRAFRMLIDSGENAFLTVIKGNGSDHYFTEMRRFVNESGIAGRVVFVDGLLPKEQLVEMVVRSDACFSFPVTDQLSSTILECLYVGAVTVTADLPAYGPLNEVDVDGKVVTVKSTDDIFGAMSTVCAAKKEKRFVQERILNSLIEKKYSFQSCLSSVRDLLSRMGGRV